jgi:hypothetical protein
MHKIVISIDANSFTQGERDFPEACKFCLEDKCDKCPFFPERIAFLRELLEEDKEKTLEQYEAEN